MRPMIICAAMLFAFSIASYAADEPAHDVESNGYVLDWLISEPIPHLKMEDTPYAKIKQASFENDALAPIGGETACVIHDGDAFTYQEKEYRFKRLTSPEPKLDFKKMFNKDNHIVYLYTTLQAREDCSAFFHLGSDDGVRVFINDQLVHDHYISRGVREHDDIFKADLKQGGNRLLVKVEQGNGGWGLILQILDATEHGKYLREHPEQYIRIELIQSGEFNETATLSPMIGFDTAGALDDMPVKWEVKPYDGKKPVFEAETRYADPAVCRLPQEPGIYTATLTAPDRELNRSTSFIVARDQKAYGAETLNQAAVRAQQYDGGPYEGWLTYKHWLAEQSGLKQGFDSQEYIAWLAEYCSWVDKVRRNPLKNMRGQFEWAYLSQVDGTGQPFTLIVPEKYTPRKAFPLRVDVHYMSGTHLVGGGAPSPANYFQLRPMGRAKAAGYGKLCEADVLDAIAYVRRHWNIDENRISITGTSMGGGGSFRFPLRHPDLFCAAMPRCGFCESLLLRNALHVPFYSLHSDDDWTVPIIASRVPLKDFAAAGGKAIRIESTGYGHDANRTPGGLEKLWEWEQRQVRPQAVDSIQYTAVDWLTRSVYWAEIIEWGPLSAPATINLRTGSDNTLYVDLENINALAIDLKQAPVDRKKTLAISIESSPTIQLEPKLPDQLYFTREGDRWNVSEAAPVEPEIRRHFPGGLSSLYHGEPLLIVWGTTGDDAMTTALHRAALLAAQSVNGGWYEEDSPRATMLYGSTPAKPDTEVTDEDIQTRNLLLLGTAQSNSVVARIADKLPARIQEGKVVTDDGASCGFQDRALGLCYYNPLNPDRLIYWAASDALDFYQAETPLMDHQTWDDVNPDLKVMSATSQTLVIQRSFQSDWQWEDGYLDSPLLPAELCERDSWMEYSCEILCRATDCDYLLVSGMDEPAKAPFFAPGETRYADLTTGDSTAYMLAMTLPEDQFTTLVYKIQKGLVTEWGEKLQLLPEPPSNADGAKERRILCTQLWMAMGYCSTMRHIPGQIEYIPYSEASVIHKHLMRESHRK
ncbi:hypothetical protein JXA32_10075 [Candidatus Sumerlaeota bacterium]|nr:hypothetical protein [Candidatus Sumerlaeota bacterium]